MDDWLKKLLSGLAAPQGSNPFKAPAEGQRNPDYLGSPPIVYQADHPYYKKPTTGPQMDEPVPVGTPLHTSVPDPSKPPFIQQRAPYGTVPTDTPPNQVPTSPPNTVTGNVAVAPFSSEVGAIDPNSLEAQLAKARGEYNTAVTDPAKKQNPWLQALFQGLQATQRIADPSNPANAQPVQWLGEAKKADRVRKAAGNLAPLEAQQERILGERYNKARTENLYEDNAHQKAVREDRATKAANDLMERKRANFYKQNKYFSVKNATPAQKRQLAEIGETPESIGDYNFSKPNLKTIGGIIYRWDENEKAFVDTNAAKDPTKAFKSITVKDPETKEVYTFVTTEENAAKMMNARQVAGLQIEAAEKRQLNQQTFTAGESEKDRQFKATVEKAKMDYGLAMKQLANAQGRSAALNKINTDFLAAFQKTNDRAFDPNNPEDVAARDEYTTIVLEILDQ